MLREPAQLPPSLPQLHRKPPSRLGTSTSPRLSAVPPATFTYAIANETFT
jgi:hypothetical protein